MMSCKKILAIGLAMVRRLPNEDLAPDLVHQLPSDGE